MRSLPHDPRKLAAIYAGGVVGALIRVGLLGGVAAAARFAIDALHGQALVIVAGGGIGSFTTFSTWILDSHRLGEAGLARLAWLNIGLSVAAGFAAVAFGHWLGGVL